jgi:hypothetical protein
MAKFTAAPCLTVRVAFFAARARDAEVRELFQARRQNAQSVWDKVGITIVQCHTARVAFFVRPVGHVTARVGSSFTSLCAELR